MLQITFITEPFTPVAVILIYLSTDELYSYVTSGKLLNLFSLLLNINYKHISLLELL